MDTSSKLLNISHLDVELVVALKYCVKYSNTHYTYNQYIHVAHVQTLNEHCARIKYCMVIIFFKSVVVTRFYKHANSYKL